jgi:hypothetical protein
MGNMIVYAGTAFMWAVLAATEPSRNLATTMWIVAGVHGLSALIYAINWTRR